jgi:adenylate cyclase
VALPSSDDPAAYLSRDLRRALAAGGELPDRVEGTALFADISGFTPLAETLAVELGPHRGAEALTAILDRVSHAVIDELHRFDGDVIYFSGDAITCWLDGDDGLRAAACAMQAAMAEVGDAVTPGGTHVGLTMKVAVAAGHARRAATWQAPGLTTRRRSHLTVERSSLRVAPRRAEPGNCG